MVYLQKHITRSQALSTCTVIFMWEKLLKYVDYLEKYTRHCAVFSFTHAAEQSVRHPLTTVNAQFSFNSLLFFLPAVSAVVRSCSFRRFCSGPAGFVWKGLELHCICRLKVLVTRSLTLLCNACCFFWPRLFFNFQLKIKQKYYISSGWTFLLAQHNCV